MKKFTAIILVFCMLAATLVTGLSVFAAQDADTGSETQKIESVNKPTAFVQFKENGNSYDTRVVVAAPEATINGYSSASIVVSFVTAEGKTVSSGPRPVTGIYLSVNAGDDTYTAADGNVLFGVVVTNVPYGTKSVSATLTATTGEEEETIDLGGSDKMPEKVYTVSELLELDEVKNLDAELYTAQKYTAKGKVTSIGATDKTGSNGQKYYQNVTISDGEKSILIYSINFVEGVTSSFKKGDTITVKGYIQNYKDKDGNLTIEFSGKDGDYPLCLAVEEGEPDATVPTIPTKGTFVKVTSQDDIGNGYYLFVYENENKLFNSTSTSDKSNVIDNVEIISGTIDLAKYGQYFVLLQKFGTDEHGYSIQLPDGSYIMGKGTGGTGIDRSDDPVENVFTYNIKDGTVRIIDQTEEHSKIYFQYNASTPSFKYFAGAMKDLTLYKLDETASSTTHTVTFMNGDQVHETQTVLDGKTATVPTKPKQDGMDFDAWCTDKDTLEKVFDFDTPITEDLTLYARFTEHTGPQVKQFVKVTDLADLDEGQYLIVCESENVVFVPSSGDSVKNCAGDVTINDATIAYSEKIAAYVVTIKKYNDGYSIEISTGYLKDKGKSKNGFETSATEVKMTITFSNSNASDKNWVDGDVLITTPNGNVFRYNKGGTEQRFRFFQSSTYHNQQSVSLYKLVGDN